MESHSCHGILLSDLVPVTYSQPNLLHRFAVRIMWGRREQCKPLQIPIRRKVGYKVNKYNRGCSNCTNPYKLFLMSVWIFVVSCQSWSKQAIFTVSKLINKILIHGIKSHKAHTRGRLGERKKCSGKRISLSRSKEKRTYNINFTQLGWYPLSSASLMGLLWGKCCSSLVVGVAALQIVPPQLFLGRLNGQSTNGSYI